MRVSPFCGNISANTQRADASAKTNGSVRLTAGADGCLEACDRSFMGQAASIGPRQFMNNTRPQLLHGVPLYAILIIANEYRFCHRVENAEHSSMYRQVFEDTYRMLFCRGRENP